MKKMLILFFIIFITVFVFNYKEIKLIWMNSVITENTEAFAANSSCYWKGFLGIRSCSISCDGCDLVDCSRHGCYSL